MSPVAKKVREGVALVEPFTYRPLPLGSLATADATAGPRWIWRNYLARGDISLLTSEWKAGKTTLLAGLLGALDTGRPFLGLDTVVSSTVIVSEEAATHWAERRGIHPGGVRARLVSRPFPGRPTAAEWDALIRRVEADREITPVDLFVVDPLAMFLPGRSDSDPAALLDLLAPLRRLATGGTAVLVMHHPRKEAADEGNAARGSGALLGYVDVAGELTRYGRLPTDANRRRLTARTRHPAPIPALVYEWVPGTDEFRGVPDEVEARFRENWDEVRRLLAGRTAAVTHRELLGGWPEDRPAPPPSQLYRWLDRAARDGLVRRVGKGTKADPYRFALPDPLRPQLPPLPEL